MCAFIPDSVVVLSPLGCLALVGLHDLAPMTFSYVVDLAPGLLGPCSFECPALVKLLAPELVCAPVGGLPPVAVLLLLMSPCCFQGRVACRKGFLPLSASLLAVIWGERAAACSSVGISKFWVSCFM